jgi:hypothetical protein
MYLFISFSGGRFDATGLWIICITNFYGDNVEVTREVRHPITTSANYYYNSNNYSSWGIFPFKVNFDNQKRSNIFRQLPEVM